MYTEYRRSWRKCFTNKQKPTTNKQKTFLSIKVDHISKEVVDEHTEYIVSVFVKITFNKRAKTKVWRDGIRRGARDWNDS